MKVLNHVLSAAAIAVTSFASATVLAQPSAPTAAAPAAAAPAAEMTEAEVRKVDKENKKVTLKHGPIKNLDMPAMTMVFNVPDAAMLDKVQAGDKVRFTASGEGGKYTVINLRPAQ